MRIVVLDGYTLNPGDLDWSALEALGQVTVHDRTPAGDILTRAAEADAVLANKTPLRRETLDALPRLRYIGVLATGYDVVDVAAARERGIVVTNIPTYGTASVAQFAFALLLELCHRTGEHSEAVRRGDWSKNADWSMARSPLVELAGKTLGVIGLGRIGGQVAKIADAMGMRVIAHSIPEGPALPYDGFRWVPLDELLAESDVVSLHCPLTPETRGVMHAGALRRMKRTAFLINTSRGPLVVEQHLADALNDGSIAGAGLDVLAVEPPPASPLFAAKNCVITPHIAWATKEARSRLMQIAVDNVGAFAAGRPENVVS